METPTSLCVTVVAYVAVAYISSVVMGWMAPRCQDELDEFDWFAAVFWPVIGLIGIVLGLAAACKFTAKRFPDIVKWTGCIWFVLTLPFRPWRIGRMLKSKWRPK